MHRALLKTFNFLSLRAKILAGRKRDSTKSVTVALHFLQSDRQSCSRGYLMQRRCRFSQRCARSGGPRWMLVWGVKASAPMWQTKQAELQFGEILPSLAIRLDGPLSARGNF